MEIVIKIPEEEYKNICLMSKDGIGMALYDWIANGTPLPKGHGDLVDRNCIRKAIYAADDNYTGMGMTYDEMDFYNEGIDSMWSKLQNADPIIKADTMRDEG